jgi:hypothetical protein
MVERGKGKGVVYAPLDRAWRQSQPRLVPAPRASFAGTRLSTARQHPNGDEQ